ncbi:MAG: EamA family transporter [Betaproteobacteria bacterium]
MNAPALFAISTAIWGSTWLVITWQLGIVPPEVSVAYRFALAAALLAAWCSTTGRSLAFTPRQHLWLAAWGAMMFGLNYVGVYYAEALVSSGLVAVLFATIVFMSPIGMRVFHGTPLSGRMLVAATLGVAGVALLFLPELESARDGGSAALGIAYALGATAIATGGNLVAVRNHAKGLPLFPTTAWGMFYGALVAAIVALAQGVTWSFDPRWPYVASLAYLAVFGSIFAFGAYLTLLKKVGAGSSAYVGVSTPVIAMLLSTLFEGYRWSWPAMLGVALAIAGNVMALRTQKPH